MKPLRNNLERRAVVVVIGVFQIEVVLEGKMIMKYVNFARLRGRKSYLVYLNPGVERVVNVSSFFPFGLDFDGGQPPSSF